MKTHLTLLLLWPALLFGQSAPLGVQLSPDCPFADYLQTEVAWPNYAANPPDVVVTADASHLYLVGNQNFKPQFDTVAVARFGPTDDRTAWLKAYRRGLLPYLLQSGQAADFEYALPGAPTAWEVVHDPWRQWVFRLSGDGNWTLERFRDQQPALGAVGRTRLISDYTLAFDLWRISPRNRFSTSLSNSFFRNRQTSSNLPPVTGVGDRDDYATSLAWGAEWVHSLNQHWSLGGRADADWVEYRYSFAFPGGPPGAQVSQNSVLGLGVGVEWSLWPYREFFRRRLLVSVLLSASHNDLDLARQRPINFNNLLLVRTAFIRQWGFWGAQVSTSVPVPDEDGTILLGTGCNVEAGWNVGQHLLLGAGLNWYLSAYRRKFQAFFPDGTAQSQVIRIHQSDFTPSLRLTYYFGQRNANVVNPRLSDFRTGNF